MSDETIEKPKIGDAAASGDSNRAASSHVDRLAQSTDRILSGRGGGDLSIYEEIRSDGKVKSAFEQRRNAVIAREWQVDAGGTKRIDIKAAEWLREQLTRIRFDNVTDKMLWGVFYGYSVAEIVWDVQDGLYGWKAVKVRRRRKFKFTESGELRRFCSTDPVNGVKSGPPYFWHLATGSDNDDEPYGMGLAHWVYWYVLFKRQGLKFWLIFLEKFGSPTVHGKFPVGASDPEIRKLLAAGMAVRTDSVVVTPDGMELDLLEAARSGTADYKVLHDTMNQTIEQVIIGQTAGSAGTPGRLGNDELQSDVRMDIVKADADLVCESFNIGPVAWMTMFNFPGAAMPRVFRVMDEPEDADALAERDTKVKKMGFKPSLAYVKDQYGPHWEESAPADATTASPNNEIEADFAEHPAVITAKRVVAQERLDAVLAGADEQSAEWRSFVEPRINELLRLLDEGGDLKDFRDRVVEFADADPNNDLVESLSRAGFAAHLIGRNSKERRDE